MISEHMSHFGDGAHRLTVSTRVLTIPLVNEPQRHGPRHLRRLLYAGGSVATLAGLHTAAVGARSIPGWSSVAEPAIESEFRFYGTFYAAYGVAVLNVARRPDPGPVAVYALAASLLAAGVARVGAWRAVGKPTRTQIALLAIELTAPPAIVACQASSRQPRP